MADRPIDVSEAVIVYDGRGVTTRVSRLTTTAMTVYADIIAPVAGEKVTVFIDGVGSTWSGASGGDAFSLVDQESGGYSFKFNNFDDHRLGGSPGFGGPDTFVGWGWVNHWAEGATPRNHVYSSDWLFTGTYVPPITNTEVPEPGALIIFGFGIAGLALHRRRKQKTV